MNAVIQMEEAETERAVFSRMAREHHRMLLAYARTLHRDENDARELVQEALVAAWKSMGRFDVSRDTGAWLRGIVRNKWREDCRQRGRGPELVDECLADLEAGLSSWEHEPEQPLLESLQKCREKLPKTFAAAVQAFYYDGLSGSDAARTLKVNAVTLRKRLERARANLQKCLQRTSNLLKPVR